jgi:hypothetical protein
VLLFACASKRGEFNHLNILKRRQLMTVKFKNSETIEEVVVSTVSTLLVLAVPMLIILASV